MSKKQIVAALVPLYRLGYAQYDRLEEQAKEAVQDGDTPAFEAISRRAVNKSHFLNGIKCAAQSLGIDESEFQAAISADADGR